MSDGLSMDRDPAPDAQTLASSFLAASIEARVTLACRLRNDHAHPGQRLALSFPPPLDVDADVLRRGAKQLDKEVGGAIGDCGVLNKFLRRPRMTESFTSFF